MTTPTTLRQQAAILLAEAVRLEEEERSRPKDEFDSGTVITFTREFSGRTYQYAGVKSGNLWYLTGKTTRAFTWDDLLKFIGPDSLHTFRSIRSSAMYGVTWDKLGNLVTAPF